MRPFGVYSTQRVVQAHCSAPWGTRTCGGSTRAGRAASRLHVQFMRPGLPHAVVSDREPRDGVRRPVRTWLERLWI